LHVPLQFVWPVPQLDTHIFMAALQEVVPVHFVMHLPPQLSCVAVQPQLPSEQVPPSGLVQLPGLAAQVPALQVSH
jgi:hypothetical protein